MMFEEQKTHLSWDKAAGMPPHDLKSDAPLGALVPDPDKARDKVAVVYDRLEGPPEITVSKASGFVQTVLANGIAVAIVASVSAPALSPEDILLVERAV